MITARFCRSDMILPTGIKRPFFNNHEMCALAAERLGEVIADGNMIIPLEEEISKAAQKNFPVFQQQFGSLGEKLNRLNVPGEGRVDEFVLI